MEQIRDRLAGLDVHRDEVRACVRTPGPGGGMHAQKARFRTTTGGLAVLAGWLMLSGWPTWPRMGWCGTVSCRRSGSGNCGS